MIREVKFPIDRPACDALAKKIFIGSSGIEKKPKQAEKMRAAAFRVREKIEDRIDIRAAYSYREDVSFSGSVATIAGETFTCNAFSQINPQTVEGVYLYAVCAGDFSFPEWDIMDQVYADIWGTAFTDAARFLLIRRLKEEHRLSDSFGPGYYGMDVIHMRKLMPLLDYADLRIKVLDAGTMVPVKSCAGMYFAVTEDYQPMPSACFRCHGARSGCNLCKVQEKKEWRNVGI